MWAMRTVWPALFDKPLLGSGVIWEHPHNLYQ